MNNYSSLMEYVLLASKLALTTGYESATNVLLVTNNGWIRGKNNWRK